MSTIINLEQEQIQRSHLKTEKILQLKISNSHDAHPVNLLDD